LGERGRVRGSASSIRFRDPEQGGVRVLGKDLRKMVIVYLLIEVFAMKAALQRAKRTGLLLKLSE